MSRMLAAVAASAVACAPDHREALVWLDPAAAAAGWGIEDLGAPIFPVLVDAEVVLAGPADDVPVDPDPGEIACVVADEADDVTVEYVRIGADVDPDAIAVAGAFPVIRRLAAAWDADIARRADGAWELSGRDVLLAEPDDEGLDGSWLIAVDPDVRAGGGGGGGAGSGRSGDRALAVGVLVGTPGSSEGAAATAGWTDGGPGDGAADTSLRPAITEEGDLAPLVGLYEDGQACLLVDASGTFSTCAQGLGRRLGTVSRDGPTLVLAPWRGGSTRLDVAFEADATVLHGPEGTWIRGTP